MPEIDSRRPHEARVYDYILGGKESYAVDRAVGDQMIAAVPSMPAGARANRDFLRRAVRSVAEQGVDQFLDIGTGLPTAENTHEVAEAANPAARTLYVDYDPLVHVHAQALLVSENTSYVLSDLREPRPILDAAARHLDLERPVAVLLVAVLHHLLDTDEPHRHVRTVLDAVPAGSHLILSHATWDFVTPTEVERLEAVTAASGMRIRPRSRAEIASFLDGLELVEPGLVAVTAWRPEGDGPATTEGVGHYGVVARKPG